MKNYSHPRIIWNLPRLWNHSQAIIQKNTSQKYNIYKYALFHRSLQSSASLSVRGRHKTIKKFPNSPSNAYKQRFLLHVMYNAEWV